MKTRKTARPYRMAARAEAAAATHARILEAAIRQLSDRFYDDVSLADVASEAGVTVQTVLRRFGSKEGLAGAATALAVERVRSQRWSAPAGDVEGAIRALLEHYEEWGERSLRFLAQEASVPAIRDVVRVARALHHEWVDHAFSERLSRERGVARTRLRARLVAVTDVCVWKVLRQDLALDDRTSATTLRELVAAVLD